MKISKKTRDEAILLCSAIASNGAEEFSIWDANAALGLEYDGPADMLRYNAWREIRRFAVEWSRTDFAEAECLLRDGWSPGDEVVRL